MPRPIVHGESHERWTKPIVGTEQVPGSLSLDPDAAPTVDSNDVVGNTKPKPNATSEHRKPLIVAGLALIAPIASIGQAAATPLIDWLTGPTEGT
jgi:hypothetical protein